MGRARLGPIHALGLPAVEGPGVPGGTGASTCILGGGGKKTREPSVSAERAEAGAVRRLPGAREETWSLPPADNSEPHAAPTQLAPKDHRRSLQSPRPPGIDTSWERAEEDTAPFTIPNYKQNGSFIHLRLLFLESLASDGGQGQNAFKVETHIGRGIGSTIHLM